jgi:diguanylate cyclase (GGDEF)-like protein
MPKRSHRFPEELPEVACCLLHNREAKELGKVISLVHANDTFYHLFSLDEDATLVVERKGSALPDTIIKALSPAAHYFYNMCQSAIRHMRVLNEVERRTQAEKRLKHIAYHDELTNLPNRVHLVNLLDHEIEQCHQSYQEGMLIYIDLDGFHDINDSLGHVIGDELLNLVAHRLGEIVQAGEVLSRLSSDEFVILCPNQYEPQARTHQILRDINQCFEKRFLIGTREIEMSASIGVAYFNALSEGAYKVLMQCNLAMSRAKAVTGVSVEYYQSDMEEKAKRRFLLDSDMRKALQTGDFELMLQPQTNHEGSIIGAECLMRWQHPDYGYISPVEFIDIAEKTGFIIPLGEWIMERACHYVVQVKDKPKNKNFRIAVNISAKQFYQANFIARTKQILAKHGVSGKDLEFEITESIMLEDVHLAIVKLEQLKKLGIEISIDDFGTGYSSLSYLKQLPLDRVKVDRSFVTDINKNTDNRTIVEAIAMMTSRFGFKLIAEGVETEEELAILLDLGCFEYQGYHFYKPMPFKNFIELF